ncbi:MAG: hypothetical protein KF729_10940 [Sandaracinaceae bacterium]|nr:hypothetical protein [Sandaracinaceae bacterium]
MARRAPRRLIQTGWALAALLASACSCTEPGASREAPAPPEGRDPPAAPRDPRVPPGFTLPLPEGATVRYGEATADRATVLVTTDEDAQATLRWAREMLEARGLEVRRREGERDRGPGASRAAIDGREGERVVASAIVERGAAEVTRLYLTQRLERGAPFHAPEEPREWRRVERPPLPAVPGPSEPACNAAVMGACEAWAAAGGPDALDCALDHRTACGRIAEPGPAARGAEDARARLADALRAHAIVGSAGARAFTLGQLRVELLAARANLVRAAAAGAPDAALAALIAAVEAEGVTIDVDTAFWFTPEGSVEGSAESAEIPPAFGP